MLASYTVGSLVVRGSYLQTNGDGKNGEWGIGVEDKFGAFSVAAGYVKGAATSSYSYTVSGTGTATTVTGKSSTTASYKGAYLAGEYALGKSNVGLLLGHNSSADNNDNGTIATLYGNTTFGATTVAAFISHASAEMTGETTKTTYGVGASYDLGSGAAMVGHVRTDRTKDVLGDLGVTFKF